jgi:hypothetical protein
LIHQHSGIFQRLARMAFAAGALFALASCGSGGVSGPVPVNDPTRLTILPNTATAYSGLPTTFVISGGTGSYIISSSNQAVIPISGGISGSTLVVVPNAVVVDTVVTLTVRDSGTTPLQSATVTVKPGTVNNEIAIVPTSTQGGSCAPAICSGGDALVSATLSLGGIPLVGRGARFDVVSGDFRFITSAPGAAVETLATTTTVVTDETGTASARIRVTATAPNQTALLQVTDLGSQAFQRSSFVIAQATGTSPGFFATPSEITFQGRLNSQCANDSVSATVFIFGGSPPYNVSSTASAFFVSRDFVSFSGGGFTITPNGTCVPDPGALIVIRDSAGRTTSVTVKNLLGTTAPPALVVAPTTVTLSSCTGSANVSVAGGAGPIFVSSGSDNVVASASGTTVTIRRADGTGVGSGPVNVGISDGQTVANVTVNFTGEAAGVCPHFTATPSSVTLTSTCANTAFVAISPIGRDWGVVAADSARILAAKNFTDSSQLMISRQPQGGTQPWLPATSVDVFVFDKANPSNGVHIPVSATGGAAGNC